MENKKNIIIGHTLEQYNKKYRNRRHVLLKYTKSFVEDFDKKYGYYVWNSKTYSLEFKNYLLEGKKWWLIDDVYYEIPKPVRFAWFRNLNAGVQIATCALLACGVGAAVATPIIIRMNDYTYFNVLIEESKKDSVSVKSVKTIKNGNTEITLNILKDGKNINDVSIRKGLIEFKENTDYELDRVNNKITIFKNSLYIQLGDITINPFLISKQKDNMTKAEWLAAYKPYSINFNTNKKNYSFSKIKIESITSGLSLYDKMPLRYQYENNYKVCAIVYKTTSQILTQVIAGYQASYDLIDNSFLKSLESKSNVKYSISNNAVEANGYDFSSGDLLYKLRINCNGYIEEYKDSVLSIKIKYDGIPDSDEYVNFINGSTNVTKLGTDYGYYFKSNYLSKINFKKDNQYMFYVQMGKIQLVQEGPLKSVYVKDFVFLDCYDLKNSISNCEITVNNDVVSSQFTNFCLNSYEVVDEVKTPFSVVCFKFKATKDFESALVTSGTIEA